MTGKRSQAVHVVAFAGAVVLWILLLGLPQVFPRSQKQASKSPAGAPTEDHAAAADVETPPEGQPLSQMDKQQARKKVRRDRKLERKARQDQEWKEARVSPLYWTFTALSLLAALTAALLVFCFRPATVDPLQWMIGVSLGMAVFGALTSWIEYFVPKGPAKNVLSHYSRVFLLGAAAYALIFHLAPEIPDPPADYDCLVLDQLVKSDDTLLWLRGNCVLRDTGAAGMVVPDLDEISGTASNGA